jgi:hypothetical protein
MLDFNETGISLTDIQKNAHLSDFIKICPVGGRLFHLDGQTDITWPNY